MAEAAENGGNAPDAVVLDARAEQAPAEVAAAIEDAVDESFAPAQSSGDAPVNLDAHPEPVRHEEGTTDVTNATDKQIGNNDQSADVDAGINDKVEILPVAAMSLAIHDTPLQPPVQDVVHIVDSDTNFIPEAADTLPQHDISLDVKVELPLAEAPIAALAPPFAMDSEIVAQVDPLPYTSDGLLDQYQEQPTPVQPATGFAKLEFQDGHFYMTTYAVELGRDMRAYRVAQQVQARMHIKEEARRPKRSASVPGTPVRPIVNETAGMSARSFLSESGGIVGDDDGHIKLRKKKRKKSSKSKSTDTSSSHSHSMSRKNSINQPQPKFDYNMAAMQTVDPNVTAPLDPMVHMPDPNFTPLIPVHPPMNSEEEFQTGKGISRKHIRISYNFDRCHFEMTVFGRNGAFLDEQHHSVGSTVPLRDGSVIQIGGVSLRFVLPTVAVEAQDREDDEIDSVSGRMSFNFEDGHGESIMADDDEMDDFSSPSTRAKAYQRDLEEFGFGYDSDEDLLVEADSDEADSEEDESSEEEEEEEEIPKRRGPGRPKIHHKGPPPKSKDRRASKTVPKPSQKAPKITLKLNAKDGVREQERQRMKAEAEAREARERERAAAKAAKIKAKELARAKAKAQAEADARRAEAKAKKERESEARAQEAAKEPRTEASIEPSKEASKTPAGDSATPKEPSAPRIARDAPMQNGEDINVPGLPAGIIIPARKKGPGRPPKDGVMSKRERAQLIKQAKEREKAIKLGLDPSTIPPPENRPPKPKPRRNSQGEEIEGEGDDDDKRPKVPRPPRSPSPEMKIEDYSEEQLQRPSANYVYLIYEAIKNSKAGVMNLQQIYSSIERKYPWYKFKAGSNGWQSSVRHNLGQHEAFKKVEKEGKGWLWGIKDGVPIERERKKKSPPPQPPPNNYPYAYPQYGQHPQYPQGQFPPRPPGAPLPPHGQQQGPPGQSGPNGYNPQYLNNGRSPAGQHGGYGPNQRQGQYGQPGRPPYPQAPQTFKRYKPPSAEVIDTFKKVFISTYASRNDNNTAKAEAIVTNAIKRVLEPETMIGVAKDTQEENVMRAFEGILVQSQGPPRQLTPSQHPSSQAHNQHTTQQQSAGQAPPPHHHGTNSNGAPPPPGQVHPQNQGAVPNATSTHPPNSLQQPIANSASPPMPNVPGQPPVHGQLHPIHSGQSARPHLQHQSSGTTTASPLHVSQLERRPSQQGPVVNEASAVPSPQPGSTAASQSGGAAPQPLHVQSFAHAGTPPAALSIAGNASGTPSATGQAPTHGTGSAASTPHGAAVRPAGPAEANLLGMLMNGPTRSNSNTPLPRSASPMVVANTDQGKTSPNVPPHQSTALPINQPSQGLPTQQPYANSRPPSAPVAQMLPGPSQTNHGLAPAISPAAQPRAPATPGGLGLNINTTQSKETIIERQLTGIPRTMTPTRPAIEPLTPPAMASPRISTSAVASSTPLSYGTPVKTGLVEAAVAGVKRQREEEASAGIAEGETEVKKLKVDTST